MPQLPKGAFLAAAALTAGLSIAAVVAAVSTTEDAPAAAPTTAPASSTAPDAAGGTGAPAEQAATIVDFAFDPEPITVAVGQPVTWTNEDSFAHTVKAVDGSFDSGNMDEAATFTTTFSAPGSYAYLCGIHNSMTGTVVVEP